MDALMNACTQRQASTNIHTCNSICKTQQGVCSVFYCRHFSYPSVFIFHLLLSVQPQGIKAVCQPLAVKSACAIYSHQPFKPFIYQGLGSRKCEMYHTFYRVVMRNQRGGSQLIDRKLINSSSNQQIFSVFFFSQTKQSNKYCIFQHFLNSVL